MFLFDIFHQSQLMPKYGSTNANLFDSPCCSTKCVLFFCVYITSQVDIFVCISYNCMKERERESTKSCSIKRHICIHSLCKPSSLVLVLLGRAAEEEPTSLYDIAQCGVCEHECFTLKALFLLVAEQP